MEFRIKKITGYFGAKLSIIDIFNLSFFIIITIFYLFSFNSIPSKTQPLMIYTFLLLLIIGMSLIRPVLIKPVFKKAILMIYPVVFLFTIFDSFYLILPYLNTNRYDELMSNIDLNLLGVYPTVWIEKFINPFLTELMYIFYFLYFPIPLILLGLMYKNSSLKKIEEYIIVYLVCYYGAYLSYFIFPVHGPRFYLADIQNVKLEGLYFTSLITGVIDLVEKNKLDCFPSLHTSILLVTLYLTYFYNKKLFYIYLPLAFGILISLIYCRYHYFIDIIAGFIWAVLSVYLGKFTYKRLSKNFIFHFGEENRYEQ